MSNKPAAAKPRAARRRSKRANKAPERSEPPVNATDIVARLGRWYDRNKRDLPWRRSKDPYAIWISEIMLQQTRVDTVRNYFVRFMDRFPRVEELAAAELDDVLRHWQGLGYYRRARQMHRAAQEVVDDWEGRLPASASELLKLSGVGRYTAGAIASIAYGEQAPIVDGNVIRVFSRIFSQDEDMGRAAGKNRIWELAGQLVPARRPGRFNQAVMELGATVCIPRNPACGRCPVALHCQAKQQGRVEELPRNLSRASVKKKELTALVFEEKGHCLLARRRVDGLFGGMWEPPMVEPAAAEEATCRQMFGIVGAAKPTQVAKVKHLLSHRAMSIEVRRCVGLQTVELAAGHADYDRLQLCPPELVALSTLAKKVLRSVGALP
jgi:A/G-specific adenine glycosylase